VRGRNYQERDTFTALTTCQSQRGGTARMNSLIYLVGLVVVVLIVLSFLGLR
jgi:hypothetical protein